MERDYSENPNTSMDGIGELTNLEKLYVWNQLDVKFNYQSQNRIITESGLTTLPDSFENLVNLKIL